MHWSLDCVREQRVAFHRILGHASVLCKQRSLRLGAESQTIPLRSVLFPTQWELFGRLWSVWMHWVQNVRGAGVRAASSSGLRGSNAPAKVGTNLLILTGMNNKRSIHKAFLDCIVPARSKVIWMHLWVWWMYMYVGKNSYIVWDWNVPFILLETFLIQKFQKYLCTPTVFPVQTFVAYIKPQG